MGTGDYDLNFETNWSQSETVLFEKMTVLDRYAAVTLIFRSPPASRQMGQRSSQEPRGD
jgi:hypothetical protein